MNEDIQLLLESAEEEMQETISYLTKKLASLRAGKANTHMLDGIKVDYYGTQTPLTQVANLNTPDAQTITIQPWEKTMTSVIEKEIMKANLGFNPSNKGDIIYINVPPLTEERRKDLVKVVKKEEENSKISIRETRRTTLAEIKKLKDDKDSGLSEDDEHRAQDDVQELTDKYIAQVEKIIEDKEKEIMTV